MKRNNKINRMLSIIFLISLAGIAGCTSNTQEVINDDKNVVETANFKTILTGSTELGDVAIELQPHSAKNGKLEVDIWANTHFVDLSQFDLARITTLESDGKVLSPTSAPFLTGHHSSGTLVFDVGNDIDAFVIKIKGMPAIEERVFEWPQ